MGLPTQKALTKSRSNMFLFENVSNLTMNSKLIMFQIVQNAFNYASAELRFPADKRPLPRIGTVLISQDNSHSFETSYTLCSAKQAQLRLIIAKCRKRSPILELAKMYAEYLTKKLLGTFAEVYNCNKCSIIQL